MKISIIALTLLSILFGGCGSEPAPETAEQKKARWDQKMQKAQDDNDRKDRENAEMSQIVKELIEAEKAKQRSGK
jgi:PBP1b-binding outer membrane lipoprotein LpoB